MEYIERKDVPKFTSRRSEGMKMPVNLCIWDLKNIRMCVSRVVCSGVAEGEEACN